MAKVPLRTYTREIETLIDRGNPDEAVAHCRHILKTFPKHLETYRMMGKAYLETKRYDQAADIFKRILMAVPDDFVSHVGMSIINDDRKNLDDTIWHMERAFETQPSNAAIQSELQRLYGRRDGMEPHKIRLTRGALAHMYVQGELYAAAIGEIRSVLADDPNRTDMLVLLALAYFRSGQKADASDTCSQLIGRAPYCLDANRVLVEILPGTGMADNAATYRGRVVELDPYASYSAGSIFQSEEVADNAIVIERLDYKAQPASQQTDWGALSLGAEAATSTAPGAQPDWLKQTEEPAPRRTQPEPAAVATPAADIPEWMRDAGWGTSTGAFDESAQQPLAEEEAPAPGEIAKADLPDWIKSMAPASAQAPQPASAAPADDDMDWLNKLGGNNPFAETSQKPAASTESPDWLSSLGEPSGASAPQASTGAVETPDWLSSLGAPIDPPVSQGATGAMDTRDWLSSLDEPASTPASQGSAGAVETPDWLSSLGAPIDPPVSEGTAGTMDTRDWLASLDEPSNAPASQGAAGAVETPDWLSSLDEESPVASEPQKPEPAPMEPASWMNEPVPAEVKPMRDNAPKSEPPAPQAATPSGLGPSIGNLGTSSADQDAAMLWLESLAAKQGAKSEELITNPADRLDKPPEWVEQAQAVSDSQAIPVHQEPPVPPVAPVYQTPAPEPVYQKPAPPPAEPVYEKPAPVEPVYQKPVEPTWPQQEDTGIFEPSADMSATDQTSAWLRNLEEEEDEKSQPKVWPEIEMTPPVTPPPAEPTLESNLPAWLRGLDKEEPAPAVANEADDLPSWLKTNEPEPEPKAEPTRAADWMPEMPKAAVVVPPEPPRVVEPPKVAEQPKYVEPRRVVEQPKAVEPKKVVEEPKVTVAPPNVVSKPAPVISKPAPVASTPPPAPVREEPAPAPKPTRPAPRKKPEVTAIDRSKLKRTGMLPSLVDPALAQARDALEHAKIPDALQAYGALIRRGKFLEEVTIDLKDALYRFPVEVSIWQVLGDAYMRANRLQDALDAYTKAEELLR